MSKEYFGDITSAYKYVVDKLPGVQNIVWTPGQDTMINKPVWGKRDYFQR